jgi:hypothetical protein
MSRDVLILVDEAAEAVASSDLGDLGWRAAGEWARGSSLAQGAVWPMIVVVAFELAECGCRVSLVGDQEAVEELAADRSDEALGDRVGPWRLHRCLDDPDVDRGEDGVEGAVNFASRSRMRNRTRWLVSSMSISRLRACWVSQAPVGWAVTPRMWTRRVACSMTKKA